MNQHYKHYNIRKFQLFMSILAKIRDQKLQGGGVKNDPPPARIGLILKKRAALHYYNYLNDF